MAYNRPYSGYGPPPNSQMYNHHAGMAPPPHQNHQPPPPQSHQYGQQPFQRGGNGPPPVWSMGGPHHGPGPHGPPHHGQTPGGPPLPPHHQQSINPWMNNISPNTPAPFRGGYGQQPPPQFAIDRSPMMKHTPNIRMTPGKRQWDNTNHQNQQNNKRNRPNNQNSLNTSSNHQQNQNQNKQQQNKTPNKVLNQQNSGQKKVWVNYKNRNFKRRSQNNNQQQNQNNQQTKQTNNNNDKQKQNMVIKTEERTEVPIENVAVSATADKAKEQDSTNAPIEDEQLKKYFVNTTGLICNLCKVFLRNIQDALVHCRTSSQHKTKLNAEIKAENEKKKEEDEAAKKQTMVNKNENEITETDATNQQQSTVNTPIKPSIQTNDENQRPETKQPETSDTIKKQSTSANNGVMEDNETSTETDAPTTTVADDATDEQKIIEEVTQKTPNIRGTRGGGRGRGNRGGRRGRGRR